MIRKLSSAQELNSYSIKDELKDNEKFMKYLNKLSNPQIEYLLQLILNEYSSSNVSDLLDSSLDINVKQELSELWTFRISHGLERR